MSVLSTFRLWFGFGPHEDDESRPTPPVTLDEKLSLAAADRAFAFDLLEDVEEALVDSSTLEAEVAAESLRRAEQGRIAAEESARRILESARQSALRYEDLAAASQANSDDDETALLHVRKLRYSELHDVGPSAEGWDS